jgi:hypothetical protein
MTDGTGLGLRSALAYRPLHGLGAQQRSPAVPGGLSTRRLTNAAEPRMPEPSPLHDYLLLSRGQWDPRKSKEEIQAAIDAFYVWYDRLVAEGQFKPGHRLAIGSKLVSRSGITDGPFTEAKELIGGYWFIVAASLQEAAAIAGQNPCLACGLSYEVRRIELERGSAYRVTNETPSPGG